jgi:hypothetical protein
VTSERPLRSRPARVRGRSDWQRLNPRQREAHYRALRAISYMRSEGVPLTVAADLAGTTPRTVHRYAGDALHRGPGRYRVALGDRLYRRMAVYGLGGRVDVDVRGSRAASLVGAHHNALSRYLATGDRRLLAPFRGKTVGGVELLTDPDQIEALAARRDLDIDDIYPRT